MRRQSVMNSASVTIPPIVMDAAAQSAILLTPLMQLQMIESGAEAGFRLEAETLASAPPRETSGGVRQSVFVLSEVVHAGVDLFVIGIIDSGLFFSAIIVDRRRIGFRRCQDRKSVV